MTSANSYDSSWLQQHRPQPMYDKEINRMLAKIFYENPADNHDLFPEYIAYFKQWIQSMKRNSYIGFDSFPFYDACIGCTQYIDDLYSRYTDKIVVLSGDYRYHERLNPQIQFVDLTTLKKGQVLIISLPFPSLADVHPQMQQILDKCLEISIPVHIDGAWITCCKNIHFDFTHPAIHSVGTSLSKGLGLGGNRIGVRMTRKRPNGPITIMNDFNMNCQALMHIGLYFMKRLGPEYFWDKYEESYYKVCKDFALKPTKAIHIAMGPDGPLGIRPLIRYLADH